MKKTALFLLIILLGSVLFAQQRYALVIGNGTYTGKPWNNLRNAVNDAVAMEAALKGLGFQVELIRNAGLSQMQTAVINLKQKLRASPQSYGFFYYAGHGAQNREGQNYLIPVDADTPSLNLLPQRAIPFQFVMDELEEARNELNMVVLDACRDVPALDRSGSRGLSVEGRVPRGTIVMYATSANKTAADGEGQNGLFTSHLLRNLKVSGIEVSEIFRRTGSDVARATNGDQYPELRFMYFETAYLGTRPAAPAVTQTAPTQPAPAQPAPAQPAPQQPQQSKPTQPAAPPPQRPVPSDMVRINGGTFTMGSPANEPGRDSDETQHQVTVSAFYMGRYQVTQKEYQEVMGTNPSKFKGDKLPVEQVTWFDAVEYCIKRSQKEGLTPAYTMSGRTPASGYPITAATVTLNRSANGYRLPTEAEWEYACRAGTTTPFSTGKKITTSQANYNGSYPYNKNAKGEYRQRTTQVGSFAPNAWGLYDMHGNVWEWCWDWFGTYLSGVQTDPAGAVSGADRVIRGGSGFEGGRFLRSATRSSHYPANVGFLTGFRLVRS